MCIAKPICFKLFAQLIREAASRAFCTAGNSIPISVEMMAITTSNSMSVKPSCFLGFSRMTEYSRDGFSEARRKLARRGERGPVRPERGQCFSQLYAGSLLDINLAGLDRLLAVLFRNDAGNGDVLEFAATADAFVVRLVVALVGQPVIDGLPLLGHLQHVGAL